MQPEATQSSRLRPSTPLLEEVLNLLSNVMFPVVIFLIWAALTTVGTLVDQNQPEQHYYDMYPLSIANTVVRLHLTGIFHSVPYISLVVLLLLSMSVCTFRRVIPKRFPKDRAVPIRNFGLHAEVATADSAAHAQAATESYLRSRGFSTRSHVEGGAQWLFGDKQKWARYGVLVAHLGFAVIALGVFLGWLRGFSGQVVLYQGDTAVVAPANLALTLNTFKADFVPVQTQNGITYQAQKFQSDVTFTDAQRTATRANVLVNHPHITPSGVYFYQASYNFAGNLRVTRNGRSVQLPGAQGRLNPQDAIFLPGTSRAIEYGTLLGPTDPSQTPPGVALPRHDEYALWVFHDNIPTTDRPALLPIGASMNVGDGYRVTALPPTPSTGLTYRYDPGQGLVATGCLILVAGFVMALFFVPVKLYAKIAAAGSGSSVEVAATTTKGNAIYEDEFAALMSGLRRAVASGRDHEGDQDRVKAYA
ncbi:MAG TPA: cytochrome c biogenesis protein ResB [Candidatus Eremiobacteraceae bacterium]|nr:cytochrome c biogenesis protein ResB [Candidatus Eremiobacteraceae bacterium]